MLFEKNSQSKASMKKGEGTSHGIYHGRDNKNSSLSMALRGEEGKRERGGRSKSFSQHSAARNAESGPNRRN